MKLSSIDYKPYLPIFVSGSLVLMLLVKLLSSGLAILQDRRLAASTTPVSISHLEIPIKQIVELHLFGKAKQSMQAPETRLPLDLVGIVNNSEHSEATAIISGVNGEKIYGIGQSLPGGAIVKKIYDDVVIIDNHGRLERLMLPIERLQLDQPLSPEPIFEDRNSE